MPLKGIDKDTVIARLQRMCPAMSVTTTIPKRVGGELELFGVEVNDIVLADMITNDGLFNTYVTIDESADGIWAKSRFSFIFRGFSEQKGEKTTVSIYQHHTTERQPWQLTDTVGPTTFPKGTPYVVLRISQGRDQSSVDNFIYVIRRLFRYYNEQQDAVARLYESVIGKLPVKRQTKFNITSNNKILQENAGDLIQKGYARQCQKRVQPMIIDDDEVEAWRARDREVLDVGPYHFVCPKDAYPHPTLLVNDQDNKDKYPCLPCCNSRPQAKKPDCTPGAAAGPGKSRARHLAYGKPGKLPRFVEVILEDAEIAEGARMGMPASESSLLHCVLHATAHKAYMRAATDAAREALVAARRAELSVRPELLAQELWDVEPDKRLADLRNPALSLDPRLFYRAIEESFGVALHVMVVAKEAGEESEVNLMTPRHKYFHVRHDLRRECMIVYICTRMRHATSSWMPAKDNQALFFQGGRQVPPGRVARHAHHHDHQ